MYISNCKINFNDWNGQTAFLGAFNSRFITSLDSGSWSNKQILSVNLRYAHFRSLLLVEIFEQPLIMLKNECSIFYAENISIGSGPGSRTLLKKCCLLVGNIYVWREDYTTLVLYTRSWNSDVWRIKLVTMSWYCITHVIEIVGEVGYIENLGLNKCDPDLAKFRHFGEVVVNHYYCMQKVVPTFTSLTNFQWFIFCIWQNFQPTLAIVYAIRQIL